MEKLLSWYPGAVANLFHWFRVTKNSGVSRRLWYFLLLSGKLCSSFGYFSLCKYGHLYSSYRLEREKPFRLNCSLYAGGASSRLPEKLVIIQWSIKYSNMTKEIRGWQASNLHTNWHGEIVAVMALCHVGYKSTSRCMSGLPAGLSTGCSCVVIWRISWSSWNWVTCRLCTQIEAPFFQLRPEWWHWCHLATPHFTTR